MKFKEKLLRFMFGRYGADQLGNFMMWTYIVLLVVNIFVKSLIIYTLALVLMILTIFRMFSKNINARNKENLKFLSIRKKITSFFKLQRDRVRDMRKKVYKKCPSCKAIVRLPRQSGKHSVVCPSCKNRFSVKIMPFAAIISIIIAVLAILTALTVLLIIFL